MNASHRLIIDPRAGAGSSSDPGGRDPVPTVVLISPARVDHVPEYLSLGAVVVMAQSSEVLASWEGLGGLGSPGPLPGNGSNGARRTTGSDRDLLDLDRRGRRVWHRGVPLGLTALEYEALAHLLESPGKAWSFHELRCVVWGPGPDYGGDVFAVRSLIQRLRRKLSQAHVHARIESVRGYGFRFEHGGD